MRASRATPAADVTGKKLKSEVVNSKGMGTYTIVEYPSASNPKKKYRVDLTNGRCDCPAWKFARGGMRKPCKHLRALGWKEVPPAPVKKIADPFVYAD